MIIPHEAPKSWTAMVLFTPGSYLKTRRTAQLLTLQDVASRIPTIARDAEHDLIAWLERIEADVVPASITTIDALHSAFRFDRLVLAALAAIARGERDPARTPRICRICACTWRQPCTHGQLTCGWVDGQDLCTACDHAPAALPAGAAAA